MKCDSPGLSDTGGAWNYAAAAGHVRLPIRAVFANNTSNDHSPDCVGLIDRVTSGCATAGILPFSVQ